MRRSRQSKTRLSVRDLESRLVPAAFTAGNVGALTPVTQQPAAVTPTPTPKVTPAATAATVQAAAAPVLIGAPVGPLLAPIRGNGVVWQNVRTKWEDGASIDIMIKNDSQSNMAGWRVEFDAPFAITNWWNAQLLSQNGNHYVFKNLPNFYNAVIVPGQTIKFGFNASFDPGSPTYINNYTLNGKQPDTGGNIGGSSTGTVGQRIIRNWGTGASSELTIQNTGNSTMLGWTVEFDAPFQITDVWNAQLISHSGNHYVFQNIPGLFNAPIKARGTGVFGFNAVFDTGTGASVQNILLNGNSAGGGGGGGGGGNTGGSTTGTFSQTVRSSWGTGASNDITIRNTGTNPMKGWTLEFDAQFTVNEVWNAQLVSSAAIPGGGFHYVFQNTPGLFNSTIKANGTTSFGFNSSFAAGTSTGISNLRINGVTIGGGNTGPGGNTGGSTTGTLSQAITRQWGLGATINVGVQNTGTSTMNGWTVEFDAPFTISDFWNAQLVSHAGNHYVFQNIQGFWNTNIPVNGTVTFGFNSLFPLGTTPTLTAGKLNGTAVTISSGGIINPTGPTSGTVLQIIRNQSNSGTTNDVTIRNTGTTPMTGWKVEFDSAFTVTEWWNAQLVSNASIGNGQFHYVFQSTPGSSNANVPVNGTVMFGFNTALTDGINRTMFNTKLNGVVVGNNGAGGTNDFGGGGGIINPTGPTTGTVLQAIRNQSVTGTTNDITIRNTGTNTMSGWTVEFDAAFTVSDYWNVQLVSSAAIGNGQTHYVFQSLPGSANAIVPVNGTAVFGFNTAITATTNRTMFNTKLNTIVVGNNGAGGTTDLGTANGGTPNPNPNPNGSTTGTVLQAIRNRLTLSATNDITIKNTGTGTMTGWMVEFDAPFTVAEVWNAQLVSSAAIGNGQFHYVFTSQPGSFNATLVANATATFGFNTLFSAGANPTMLNTKLNGVVVGNNGAGGTIDFGTGNNNPGGGGTNQNFTATVAVTATDYGPGSTNNVTINNTGTTAINGWTLEFDAPFTINQVWNATLAGSTANPGGGYHYTFNNIVNFFNANIPAGGNAVLGFNTVYATGSKVSGLSNIKVNGKVI